MTDPDEDYTPEQIATLKADFAAMVERRDSLRRAGERYPQLLAALWALEAEMRKGERVIDRVTFADRLAALLKAHQL